MEVEDKIERVGASEFARMIGVRPQAVSQAIAAGRLVKSIKRLPNGRYEIDVRAGLEEWDNKRRGATKGKVDTSEVAQSERQLKHYQAELARLKFEEQEKLLVASKDVERASFKAARAVRDAMMTIPGKLAAELAGETDQFKIHERIETEIRQALENLSSAVEVIETNGNNIEGE